MAERLLPTGVLCGPVFPGTPSHNSQRPDHRMHRHGADKSEREGNDRVLLPLFRRPNLFYVLQGEERLGEARSLNCLNENLVLSRVQVAA